MILLNYKFVALTKVFLGFFSHPAEDLEIDDCSKMFLNPSTDATSTSNHSAVRSSPTGSLF